MLKRKIQWVLHNKRLFMMTFISIFICFITIGYAAKITTLSINGSAQIIDLPYVVNFTNVRVFGGSVEPTNAANISNKTSVSFNVTLKKAGEYYKFLVDVENTGNNDAMIKDIISPTVSSNLEFIATYKDGTAINVNDILKTGTKKTLLIILKYKDGIASSTTEQNVEFTIDYAQADASAKVPTVEYTMDDFINITNTVSTTSYASNSAQTEMYAFNHEATSQLGANTDYRYIGNVPDNYITFNGETWRIIGIFQTNDGQNRLKIIKDTSLGTLKWDNKMTGVGSSTSDRSSGDWIDAQLMYFLNPDDIATNVGLKTGYSFDGTLVKDANNTVIYELGKIPAEVVNGATTYNGMKNDWRVSTDALTKVDSVTYYLGGRGWDDTTHYGTAKDMYEWERGTTTYKDSRATNWSGKVGLIYPSDYGYTFAKGIDDTCYNDSYNCRNNTAKKSWIFNDKSQWTLESYIGYGYCVFYIRGDGFFSNNFANDSDKVVRPVVYLKPTIKLGGLGTEQDPYTIIS